MLDPVIDEVFRQAHRQGRAEPREAYAFDAPLRLARRGGDADDPPSDGAVQRQTAAGPGDAADPDDAADAGGPGRRARARPGRSNPAFLALLRVDLDALVRGRVVGDELCEIAGVGAVPARVARGLLGDAVLKLVISRGVDVVNVTHLGRGPTAAQRVALLWGSPACTNSSCTNTLAIQHDHRTPWAEVRETVVGNLDRLCPPCHRRKTHDGWALTTGEGARPLVPPTDARHPHHARDPGGGPSVGAPLAAQGSPTGP